ncbi:MAG TPA: ABC transporter permease [Gemmatimonadaceae bacterium]|nr:ABC transporter permease [Gemmatimonadaceae bacterium]
MSVDHAPGVRRVFRFPWRSRRQVADDVDDELRLHLELVADDLRTAGWPDSEARAEAERRFGDLEYTRNYCRAEDARREQEKRRMTFFDELRQDLRYAMRSLRSSPAFTATALLTLALGIGANTAIFSVVRGVLLDALPFPQSDRLVRVWQANHARGSEQAPASEPDFFDWQRESRRAASMGAYFFANGMTGVDLTGSGSPERLSAALVTDGFFQTLRTVPLLGRTLIADNHVPGRDRVAVISHGLWMRRFGGNPAIIGSTITLNGDPFLVAGVMPQGFVYPSDQALDVWIPLSYFGPESIGRSRGARFLSVVARLNPGVTESQFHGELAAISTRLAAQYPDDDLGWDDVSMLGIRESIVGEVRQPLVVLMVAVAMLLLIACVNIASLLLARATGRQRELALRAALGAGRGRIARQLLTESVTLSLIGGAIGVGLGLVAVRALAAAGTSELPRSNDIRIDGLVLAFTFGVSLFSGLLFGILPTIRASSAKLEQTLRAGARGSIGGAGQRARSALVVVEVALAVILVVGAGLATKSFARLLAVNSGFQPSHALVATMTVPPRYSASEARANYFYAVLDAIRGIRGVEAAGSIRDLPLRANGESVSFGVPGRTFAPGQEPSSRYHHITTDYFKAMGIPLRAGRSFALTDRANTPPVIVVNEEFARRIWPGENAIGKTVTFGDTPLTVIGVVGNVRQRGLAEPIEPAMYIHVLQNARVRMSIVVRTAGDPLAYAGAVRQAIWSVDANQTITNVATLESVLGDAVVRPRLLAWLLALFGAIGLALGALGIFGVLAYAVTQRRQEIGVRVALGASPRSVLSLIVGRGMALAGIGVVLGLIGALLLTRSMQTVLYDIQPSDPLTFGEVVVALLGASLLASWLPARRALAIDPVTALRYD